MRSILYRCLILSLLPAAAWAVEQEYVKVRSLPPAPLIRGKLTQVPVDIEIGKEFHIQANPAATPQLIPTTLEIEKQKDLTFQPVVYPPGKRYRLHTSPQEILVYSGRVQFKVPVTAASTAAPGTRRLKAKFRFQACDETICFFPLTLPIEIPVRIKDK